MAEAFTVDKLRGGHLGQHRPFFRRRCDDPGRVARHRIWALRLPSRLEHIHYVLTFNDPLAVGWVSQSSFGLRNTLALFSWIELIAILMFMRLPTIASVDVSNTERTSASFNH